MVGPTQGAPGAPLGAMAIPAGSRPGPAPSARRAGPRGRGSGLLTEDVLLGEAQKWLLAQHIVIGHANFPTITHLYGQIIDILRERALLTATLDDVYFGPGHNRHV